MAMKTFAAILVGSSELELKVYEISKKIGIRELDHVRYMIELGSDTYSQGKISSDTVSELCHVLKNFTIKLNEYRVDDYVAYGGSALREAANSDVILDQIRIRTGLNVKIISNAQQRFLVFKSAAFKMKNFESLINEGAAVIDIGSGSIQVSAFEDGVLQFSKNIRLGALRIRELLSSLEGQTSDFVSVMQEFVDNGIRSYSLDRLNEMHIKHVVVVGSDFSTIMKSVNIKSADGNMTMQQFRKAYDYLITKNPNQVETALEIPSEQASILVPTLIVLNRLIGQTSAGMLWQTTSDLCDGMALDYSQKVERYLLAHDFSKDIIKSVRYIARKFMSDELHIRNVENLSKQLFDATKKISGLSGRHRLLLQIAALLHDTGKYINGNNSVYNSCHIIREIEIIGLSDAEKEIVSCIVLYNSSSFVPKYEDMSHEIDKDRYIDMLKLTAIFGLANAMDKSHRQKIDRIRVAIADNEMKIVADTIYDITLEQGMVEEKAGLFEEIFGIHPVLRQKRSI